MCTCRAARPVPRRCSRASCCSRSGSSGKTWLTSGAESPLAPPSETEAESVADEERQDLLDRLTADPGDAVESHHLRPADDLWVRIRTDAWRTAGLALRDAVGCEYFCFLSAIDWMPS